jgi:hypothetical protein
VSLPRLSPLLPARVAEPFDDSHFIFKLKQDGFRALAHLERGQPARLVSRRGIDYRSDGALAASLGVGSGSVVEVPAGKKEILGRLSINGWWNVERVAAGKSRSCALLGAAGLHHRRGDFFG